MSFQNPTFNQLAQAAHAFAAYSIIFTIGEKIGHWEAFAAMGLLVVYGLGKEFWYDIKYERAEVSGGWSGGLEDFSFYMIGGLIGLVFMVR